jgi:uncharacterized membrane protein
VVVVKTVQAKVRVAFAVMMMMMMLLLLVVVVVMVVVLKTVQAMVRAGMWAAQEVGDKIKCIRRARGGYRQKPGWHGQSCCRWWH